MEKKKLPDVEFKRIDVKETLFLLASLSFLYFVDLLPLDVFLYTSGMWLSLVGFRKFFDRTFGVDSEQTYIVQWTKYGFVSVSAVSAILLAVVMIENNLYTKLALATFGIMPVLVMGAVLIAICLQPVNGWPGNLKYKKLVEYFWPFVYLLPVYLLKQGWSLISIVSLSASITIALHFFWCNAMWLANKIWLAIRKFQARRHNKKYGYDEHGVKKTSDGIEVNPYMTLIEMAELFSLPFNLVFSMWVNRKSTRIITGASLIILALVSLLSW